MLYSAFLFLHLNVYITLLLPTFPAQLSTAFGLIPVNTLSSCLNFFMCIILSKVTVTIQVHGYTCTEMCGGSGSWNEKLNE